MTSLSLNLIRPEMLKINCFYHMHCILVSNDPIIQQKYNCMLVYTAAIWLNVLVLFCLHISTNCHVARMMNNKIHMLTVLKLKLRFFGYNCFWYTPYFIPFVWIGSNTTKNVWGNYLICSVLCAEVVHLCSYV